MDSTTQIAALCRALGMQEFGSVAALASVVPGAAWLSVGPERHARVLFYDASRRVTVLPEMATACKPGWGVVPFFSGSTMRVGRIRLAQWLGREYKRQIRELTKRHATSSTPSPIIQHTSGGNDAVH